MLPTVVDSSGVVGPATALPGAPPIAALVGDQQASLLGQACVRPGPAKITFGTGGMLDMVLGADRPDVRDPRRRRHVPDHHLAHRRARTPGGSRRSCWPRARTSSGCATTSGSSRARTRATTVAQQCADTGGVVFVPALLGLGTPQWDFGARGTVLGLTRGSGRPELVRAVLEGVAQRGADLVEAAETDAGRTIEVLRIDGGMSRNPTFVQALADAAQKPVEVSPVKEATTLGAGFLAGLAVGIWPDLDALDGTWKPLHPLRAGRAARPRPLAARRSNAPARWIPELSTVDF